MTKTQKHLLIGAVVLVGAYVVYTKAKQNKMKKAIAAAAGTDTTAPKDSFGGNTGSNWWNNIFG